MRKNIISNRSKKSLPSQAPPSTFQFPAACSRRHHRRHYSSGCNLLTNKEKERRPQLEHPNLLVKICNAQFSKGTELLCYNSKAY